MILSEYVGYKLKLYPEEEQKKILFEYFGVCRFIYNFGLNLQNEQYEKHLNDSSNKSLLSFIDMNNRLTSLKKEDNYLWLNNYDSTAIKLVLRDVFNAYKYFLNKNMSNKHPTFKKKKKWANQQFPIRSDTMSIYDDYVKLPSIGIVKYNRHNNNDIIGLGDRRSKKCKMYTNPRVIFDGYSFWLTFSLPKSHDNNIEINSCKRFLNNDVWDHKAYTEGLGLDINAHHNTWITLSDDTVIKRPRVDDINKKIKKYKYKLNTKRKINIENYIKEKKTNSALGNNIPEEPNYTKNEIKILKKLNKLYKHRTNRVKNSIHEAACIILDKKPEYLVIEDIDVSDMFIPKSSEINNRHRKNHNRLIASAKMYQTLDIITYKLIDNGIQVIKADKEFPSSQLCSRCGHRQYIGSNRVYKCSCCGNIVDRDINAAKNLANYLNFDRLAYIS